MKYDIYIYMQIKQNDRQTDREGESVKYFIKQVPPRDERDMNQTLFDIHKGLL